jgi:phage anti-repressor protein/predicted GIY-YIG superfamily endonuclease
MEAKNQSQTGGQNKEQILMTVDCFKVFCLTAKKDKAKQIRKYYVKLEKLLQETIEEESNELRKQLSLKDVQLEEQIEDTHNTFLINFDKKPVVYFLLIDGKLIKFGYTNDIKDRIRRHRNDFGKELYLENCNILELKIQKTTKIKKVSCKLKKLIQI